MPNRMKRSLVPLVAGLMVITGLAASVSASTGIQLPTWGGNLPAELRPGPLGLNPAVEQPVVPLSITIPDADVNAEVERNQIVDGIMLDPSGPWVVSWYQETGKLGELDNIVMSGHVDYWDVGPAVFWTVGDLEEGAPIQVRGENGATYTYEVEWVKDYEVAGLTSETINEIVGPTDYRALTLITCGGDFNFDTGQYPDRTIIRARLVDVEGIGSVEPAAPEQVEEAPIEEPAAEEAVEPGVLAVGGAAMVTDDGVNVRGNPTTTAEVLTSLSAGQQVTILDGPVEADGFTWWEVAVSDDSQGWVAGDFLEP